MAHYAYLDDEGIVFAVVVGREENDLEPGVSSWEDYFSSKDGVSKAVRTSYNTRGGIHYSPETGEESDDQSKAFRKNYAGIGFTYDEERDAFIPPQPYDSWVLNEETCLWDAPVAYPSDEKKYAWNESAVAWVEVEDEAV
jgi:hypothetical protein